MKGSKTNKNWIGFGEVLHPVWRSETERKHAQAVHRRGPTREGRNQYFLLTNREELLFLVVLALP
jgi:hypothetical protein